MFDISWSEIFVIAVVAVLFIGPKEIPQVMRTLGQIVRRLQYMKYTLMNQVDAVMKESDLDELRRGVNRKIMDFDEDTDEADADREILELRPEKDKPADVA